MIASPDSQFSPDARETPESKRTGSDRFLRTALGVSLAAHLVLFAVGPRLLSLNKERDGAVSVEDLAVVNVETAPPSDAALAADVKLRETASAPVKESAPKPPPVPVAPKALVKWSPPPPPRRRIVRVEEPRKPVFRPFQNLRRLVAKAPVKPDVERMTPPVSKPLPRPVNAPRPKVAMRPVSPSPAPPAPTPRPTAMEPRPSAPDPAPAPRAAEPPKPKPEPRRALIALRPSDTNLRGSSGGNGGGGGGGNEGRQPSPNSSPAAPVSVPPAPSGGNGSPSLGSPSRGGDTPSGSGGGSNGGHEGGRSEGSRGGSGGGKGSGNGPGEGSESGPGRNIGSGGGEDGGSGRGHRRRRDRDEDRNEGKGSGEGHDESFRSRLADRQEPELTRDAAPDYPDSAREDGASGSVTLSYTVNGEGRVEDVRVTKSSGDDRLDRAAASAARRWRYKPAVQDGQPRSVKWRRTLRFDLQ